MDYKASKTKHAKVIRIFSYLFVVFLYIVGISPLSAVTVTSTQSVSIHALVIDPNATTTATTTENPLISFGGGGSFLSPVITKGTITLSGIFLPHSEISILISGLLTKKITTDEQGYFSLSLPNFSTGIYSLLLIGKDPLYKGYISEVPVTVSIHDSVETILSNILFPPLFTVNKEVYAENEKITVSGKYLQNTTVAIFVDKVLNETIFTSKNGSFTTNLTNLFSLGTHDISLRGQSASSTTLETKITTITIVKNNIKVVKKSGACNNKADFSGDCRVNLIDFSILAYWHNRDNFPKKFDLNKDGKIDIRDFSILAFYWSD